jgi:hypothetical protein
LLHIVDDYRGAFATGSGFNMRRGADSNMAATGGLMRRTGTKNTYKR